MKRRDATLGLGIALAAFVVGCGSGERAECPLPRPELPVLLPLLVEHRFVELEAALRGYVDAAERDPACDGWAWDTFGTGDGGPDNPNRFEDLDAFVAAQPDSFVPYALRGGRWVHEGFYRRGVLTAGETTAEQFAGMREAFARAEPDLIRAIELRPTAGAAYGFRLQILYALGDAAGVYETYAAGLAEMPDSHRLRAMMVEARAPKWGGSRREQAATALAAWGRRGHNPRMSFVVGEVFASLGDTAWYRFRPLAGVYYQLAIVADDSDVFIERRMKTRNLAGDWEGAGEDARLVIEQNPHSDAAWGTLAYALQQRNDYAGAVAELTRGIHYRPDSIRLVEKRAFCAGKAKQFDVADADYKQLIARDRTSLRYQAYSRYIVEERKRGFEEAASVMREAIALDPLDAENWSHLAGAQYVLRDPEMRASYERFLDLLDVSIPENAARAAGIRSFLRMRAQPPRASERARPVSATR